MKVKHKDILIVGQGIAGTIFSFLCHKNGLSFDVVDKGHEKAASSVSSGLINPITGRRFKKTWKYETLKNYFLPLYMELQEELRIPIIREIKILRALTTAKAKNYWDTRKTDPEYAPYMSDDQDLGQFDSIMGDVEIGKTLGCYQIAINHLLRKWKEFLKKTGQMIEEEFPTDKYNPTSEIKYKDITYSKILFCSGAVARKSEVWDFIPFIPSKGEILIDSTQNFTENQILKNRVFYVPKFDGSLWIGTANDWNPKENEEITEKARLELQKKIKETSTLDPTITEQRTAIRPLTKDRLPVIGSHLNHPNVYILNGLGTMGMSRAPYCAVMLHRNMYEGVELPGEIDVGRYNVG